MPTRDILLSPGSREEIGVLTSLPLLRKIVEDLEAARNNGGSSVTLYFTKESHVHTLVNLVLLSGLPIANRRIPELDYCVRNVRFPARLDKANLHNTVTHYVRHFLFMSDAGLTSFVAVSSFMKGILGVVTLTKSTLSSYL